MVSSLGSHALKALTPQLAVTVDRSRCGRHRCSRNECRRCLDVCPSGVITWGDRGLRVDSDSCVQCMRCLSACPTAAFRAPEVSLPRILSELAAHPQPVLGCLRQSASESHARLPCLGCLADDEWLTLLALTQTEGLQINLTACHACPNGQVVADVHDAHARLSAIEPDHGIRLVYDRDRLEYRDPSVSRRELFVLFRKRSTRTAAVMAGRLQAEVRQESYGNKRLPSVRALLCKAMEGLPEGRQLRIAERLFGRVHFTPDCDACGGCAGVCPTGAIRRAADSGGAPIFERDLCVACGTCQAFCLKQGVTLADEDRCQSFAGDRRSVASEGLGAAQ